MPIINLTQWSFEVGGGHPVLVSQGLAQPPKLLHFPDAVKLLIHLADDATWESAIQGAIHRRLKVDPETTDWHRQRSLLKNLHHFPRYRGCHYDTYHNAARNVAHGTSTVQQTSMVSGLNSEISASKVVVPTGQVLFHGRADQALTAAANYPSFISTSLDPVVAICSALRRSGIGAKSHPFVYILTTRNPLQGLWGNGGKLQEWEVLLQSNLACRLERLHKGSRFDIIEATIGI